MIRLAAIAFAASMVLALSFLAGCDGCSVGGGEDALPGGTSPGASWADPWTIGFVEPFERAGDEACFARLVRASIGGEFDDFGDEELVLSFEAAGKRILVHSKSVDLSNSALTEVPFEGTIYVELRPESPIAFVVSADDADVTEYERITSAECRLALTDFPTREAERAFPAQPIHTGSGTLEGASITLALARVPRRFEPDAAARDAARGLFGGFLAAGAPDTAEGAAALAPGLERAARQAALEAGGSLDTARRGLLVQLARLAGPLAVAAEAYGRASPAAIGTAQSPVRREAAGLGSHEVGLAALGLAEREIPPAPEARDLDDFLSRVRQLRRTLDERGRGDGSFRHAASGLDRALDDLEEALEKARQGLDRRPEVQEGWRKLVREIRSASGA